MDPVVFFGANTAYPFDAGSARMVINGNYLFVRTCHKMYNGHQANVTFSVDTSSMNIVDKFTGVWNTSNGYVSHSFNQFIQVDNGTLLGVDHGEGYPTALVLSKYVSDISSGNFQSGIATPCKKPYFYVSGKRHQYSLQLHRSFPGCFQNTPILPT